MTSSLNLTGSQVSVRLGTAMNETATLRRLFYFARVLGAADGILMLALRLLSAAWPTVSLASPLIFLRVSDEPILVDDFFLEDAEKRLTAERNH
jgi:hypothetical protein